MRKSIVSGLLIAAVTLNQTPQANAGAFATELTQVLNHGQLVMSYIRQGQQLAEEIRQYADMVRNSRMVPTQIFGSIMADLDALASIVQNGMGLAYSLANLDAEFRTRFRGYAHTARAYYTDYRTWSQTSLDTTLGALRAAGLQGRQLRNEQAVLASLRAMSQSSDGRMQALQVANQIAEQQVQQLMKLRELMLADLSSKQAYQAAVIQQKAAAEAATERFFLFQRDVSDGRTFRAGWR
jgi:P-type conjugative transfer protein TrbJ